MYGGVIHLRNHRYNKWHPEIKLPYCKIAKCCASLECHIVAIGKNGCMDTAETGNSLGIYADGDVTYSMLLKAISKYRKGYERIYLYGDYRPGKN